MAVQIMPSPLFGTVPAIPSKSDAHRLLIAAALADGPTCLHLPSTSNDIETTVSCLEAMGVSIERSGEYVKVTPVSAPRSAPLLDCRESGSTLRFLLPVAAAVCPGACFDGCGRLPQRPISELVSVISDHGVSVSAPTLPFCLEGELGGGKYEIAGNVSSQYISGLLLALPLCPEDSVISLTAPLHSRGYVYMTVSTLQRFGISVTCKESEFIIPGGQRYRSPGSVEVDGDWSNAAFFLAAGAIGGDITVTGLSHASPQGDRAVTELLARFGARVETEGDAVRVRSRPLKGCRIDVEEIPDLLSILAVTAAFAKGETIFTGAGRLRLKESDRLETTAALLRSLGGVCEVRKDEMTVWGGGLRGGEAEGFGDHRIVMAAAIAAAFCREPVGINGEEAARKSYPGFFEDFKRLGGDVNVL